MVIGLLVTLDLWAFRFFYSVGLLTGLVSITNTSSVSNTDNCHWYAAVLLLTPYTLVITQPQMQLIDWMIHRYLVHRETIRWPPNGLPMYQIPVEWSIKIVHNHDNIVQFNQLHYSI